jgi:1-pyrroline-5-carboxylate dehydrogenase
MMNGLIQITKPSNEPVYSYAPGTPEREALKMQLEKMLGEEIEISLIIGGKEV